MFNLLIFLHVASALLLGCYLLLPFLINRLTTATGQALESCIGLLLILTRASHVALIVLLLTGGGMISQLGTMPSLLWISLALVLLVIIGGVIGMISKRLKQLRAAAKEDQLKAKHIEKMKIYSWVAALAVIVAILIMTNPNLLS
ncbi:hypothetical protein ACFO4N_09270 [Camelliibacillus cellulosilyticus]|uniref:DUF2269 family protein n=1 Tax=Camelliibacillus cellulosilyticus TaxID=2174486 RepID=A0ABV9GLN2_9BACL